MPLLLRASLWTLADLVGHEIMYEEDEFVEKVGTPLA
jgi:hypothetical protein